ncbi:MAG: hypothetical protein LUG98_03430 [Tannerellaceae bacterium]|nr:hypothetical protein [Tannerellaceae bacterium]
MTIERLEAIAAYLYKEAEEATPIIGGADKKDWMARRLEEIVEEKEPALNDYLSCETTDEVLGMLETEYQDYKDEDDLVAETAEEEFMIPASPVVTPEEERLIADEDVADREGIDREDASEEPKVDEKKTGVKDELPDPYVDDRPAQPEFIGRDPEYFDEPAIIVEEEILIINDMEDDRQNPLIDQTEDSREKKTPSEQSNGCGCN